MVGEMILITNSDNHKNRNGDQQRQAIPIMLIFGKAQHDTKRHKTLRRQPISSAVIKKSIAASSSVSLGRVLTLETGAGSNPCAK